MSEQSFQLAFQFLKEEAPAAARLLEQQNTQDVAAFLSKAPVASSIKVMQSMVPDFAASVLASVEHENAATWMLALETPELCALLRYLSDKDMDRLLRLIPLKKQTTCQLLLSYRADMIGAWAETDIPIATTQMQTGELVKRLKTRRYRENRLVIVLDEKRLPAGVIHPADLFQAHAERPLKQFMSHQIATLRGRVSLATAIKQELWQQSDHVIVVNRHRQWVGLLWHSKLLNQLGQHSTHPSLRAESPQTFNQVLEAHGNSMKALLSAVHESLSR